MSLIRRRQKMTKFETQLTAIEKAFQKTRLTYTSSKGSQFSIRGSKRQNTKGMPRDGTNVASRFWTSEATISKIDEVKGLLRTRPKGKG